MWSAGMERAGAKAGVGVPVGDGWSAPLLSTSFSWRGGRRSSVRVYARAYTCIHVHTHA